MKNIFYSLFLITIIFTSSCKKKEENTNNKTIDYSYCPLILGSWITYDVTEINIDKPSEINDTLTYQIKEIIESSFIENNETIYRIERYIKLSDTTSWAIKDVWTANYTANSFQKVEENIRYIKIIFPIKINNKWNGNTYNIYDSKDYEMTSFDNPESINSIPFDSVLTVTQLNISNLIEKKIEVEKYAKNIGLIYKELTDIYSDKIIPNIPIEERVKTGSIYKMTITNYGSK